MVNTLDQFAFFLEKAINFTNFRENNVLVSINEQKLTDKKESFEISEKMIKIRQRQTIISIQYPTDMKYEETATTGHF